MHLYLGLALVQVAWATDYARKPNYRLHDSSSTKRRSKYYMDDLNLYPKTKIIIVQRDLVQLCLEFCYRL